MAKMEIDNIYYNTNNKILCLNDFIKRQEYIESYMKTCKFRRTNHLKLQKKVLKLQEILKKKFIKDLDPIIFLH